MTSFEKYTIDMEAFRQSKLFAEKYGKLISYFEDNCEGRERVTCGDILCEEPWNAKKGTCLRPTSTP